jgi:hypothetical protein
MGLFFFRKEIEREQFAQRLDSLESQIMILNATIDELINLIPNEVAKQIQSARAVEKAHEKHPSLEKRMKTKRTRRVGTYAEKQYNEPFRIAWTMKNNGHSRAQIADALNARGFTTPHSNEFTVKVVTDLMHNQYQKKQMEYEKAKQAKQIAIQTDSQRNFLNGIM